MPGDDRADPVVDLPAVLVVGTDDWAVEQARAALERAGHEVMRCQEAGAEPFPCFGVRAEGGCPLDRGAEVALAVRNRSAAHLAPLESGVICALHRGVPLVAAGMVNAAPYETFAAATVAHDQDTSSACLEVARQALATPPVRTTDSEVVSR